MHGPIRSTVHHALDIVDINCNGVFLSVFICNVSISFAPVYECNP